MADYTPAYLRIGGEITKAQYHDIQRLTYVGVQARWGECYDLGDDQARGGAFPELEAYLVQARIAFDRYSEPALGSDGRLVQFRPGMTLPEEFPASGDFGERLVPVSEIAAILAAHSPAGPGSERLVSKLRELCDPAVDPLPPFRVR